MSQISKKTLENDQSKPLYNHSEIDDSTFEIFFKENFSGLCVYCQCKFGFDIELAKEVVHVGFIKLWENRKSISPELSVTAYLRKIISNLCIDIIRHKEVKQKHEKYVLESSGAVFDKSHFDEAEINELKNNIHNAVLELPLQMRKIFQLSRFEGLKYSEIAAQLSLSVKTVETQMGRAIIKLRQKLAQYLPVYLTLIFLLGDA